MLYLENPDVDEGELAKRRASLVSSAALAEIAVNIQLGRYLLLGRGEELTGGREKQSILADCVEAIIGAAYLSVGPDAATALVLRLIAPLMADPDRFGASMDPKTSLQELSTRLGKGLPHYTVTDSGPDHSKRFAAEVAIAGETIASGDGTSKKQAEMAAALAAWAILQRPQR
jgi:ribonuclease-3